jgi:hypothetical protein
MHNYIIRWSQLYPEWSRFAESNLESLLEKSDYSEANSVISYIKGL